MSRPLLAALLAAVLVPACAMPPGDAEQIRRLVRDEAEALARGDAARLYRLHDPDFRALCPLDRFRAMPHLSASTPGAAAPVAGVGEIETRGVRGWATVRLASGADERRAFVRDAGRWYLYEDVGPCLGGDAAGSPKDARPAPPPPRAPSALVAAHG